MELNQLDLEEIVMVDREEIKEVVTALLERGNKENRLLWKRIKELGGEEIRGIVKGSSPFKQRPTELTAEITTQALLGKITPEIYQKKLRSESKKAKREPRCFQIAWEAAEDFIDEKLLGRTREIIELNQKILKEVFEIAAEKNIPPVKVPKSEQLYFELIRRIHGSKENHSRELQRATIESCDWENIVSCTTKATETIVECVVKKETAKISRKELGKRYGKSLTSEEYSTAVADAMSTEEISKEISKAISEITPEMVEKVKNAMNIEFYSLWEKFLEAVRNALEEYTSRVWAD